jgi:hypothetical protein
MSFDPFQQIQFMDRVHSNAPVDKNLQILFKDVMVGDRHFINLYDDCMARTTTKAAGWKAFRRSLRALNLVKYFEHSLSLAGARAECGVLRGFSALLVASVHHIHDSGFVGQDFHLIDSFEGLSEPTESDAIGYRDLGGGRREAVYSHNPGDFAADVKAVEETMAPFPKTAIHKGWIPDVFDSLPDTDWAFVHIDVDLHEPTFQCLEYFVPRMVKGGCIVNDDFSSPLFPGGGSGWAEYCAQNNLSYVMLDSGQSVFILD